MNVIQHWIRHRSHQYEDGLDLLNRFGTNGRMVEALRRRKNPDKVKYELQKLARTPGLPAPGEMLQSREELLRQVRELTRKIDQNVGNPVISGATPARSQPKRGKNARNSDKTDTFYPAAIAKAIQERSTLANKRDKLSNSLAGLKTDEDRKAVRKEISDLHKRIQDYNDVVGKWEREKKITEVVPEPEAQLSKEERKALMRDLRNARANRSKKSDRLKKWQHDTKSPEYKREIQIDKYKREFAGWDERCKNLEKILGI